jgi:hypothetical protein
MTIMAYTLGFFLFLTCENRLADQFVNRVQIVELVLRL